MADTSKFYVMKGDKTLVEGLTKEQTLAAITQAVEGHEIHDVDTGFVSTLKESNRNRPLKFWVGTQAEYNAIQTPDENTFYIISDSTLKEDIEQSITDLQSEIAGVQTNLQGQITTNANSINSSGFIRDKSSFDFWNRGAGDWADAFSSSTIYAYTISTAGGAGAIQIYMALQFTNAHSNVVSDYDETLGHFGSLYGLLPSGKKYRFVSVGSAGSKLAFEFSRGGEALGMPVDVYSWGTASVQAGEWFIVNATLLYGTEV